MDLVKRRQNFIEKVQILFNYLTQEYGYTPGQLEQFEWTDEISYENKSIDRKVILSNSYHPVDYGFEIQWYRPSISTKHSDREFQIFVLKEDQSDEQEYLLDAAERLRDQFEKIIKGENWIET